MSLNQIQMANNQTVNSWFIQRLKSILQGNSGSASQTAASGP